MPIVKWIRFSSRTTSGLLNSKKCHLKNSHHQLSLFRTKNHLYTNFYNSNFFFNVYFDIICWKETFLLEKNPFGIAITNKSQKCIVQTKTYLRDF